MTSKLTFFKIKKNKGMQQDIKQHQTFLPCKQKQHLNRPLLNFPLKYRSAFTNKPCFLKERRKRIHSYLKWGPGVAVCHSSAAAGQRVPLKWERRSECGDIYWLGALPRGATIQQLPPPPLHPVCFPPLHLSGLSSVVSTLQSECNITIYTMLAKVRLVMASCYNITEDRGG